MQRLLSAVQQPQHTSVAESAAPTVPLTVASCLPERRHTADARVPDRGAVANLPHAPAGMARLELESTELELSAANVLEKDPANVVAELEMNRATAVTATPSAVAVDADESVAETGADEASYPPATLAAASSASVAGALLEHARDETNQPALGASEPELSPVSALEKQLADAMAELELTRAAATPAAVVGAAESPTAALEWCGAPHLERQPRFSIGARVSVPTVGYVGCVVEGVVSSAEGYLYTLQARGIPTLEGVSEALLK